MKGRVWRLFAWLFRIRTRLLLVNVLVVAVPLLGVGFARFYEREMLRGLEEDMIHQAELVKQVVLHDPSGLRLDAHEGLLRAAAKRTRTRIRLLGPAGEVISDSHAKGPPEGPEPPPPSYVTRTQDTRWGTVGEPKLVDVSHRSEVMAALSGSYGASARFWENRSVLYLFSAVPIEQKGVVSGVVYVTRSTNPVRSAMYRLRTQLLYILAGSVAVTVVLSLFLAATISRPLSRLTERAKRVAKGEKGVTLALARRDEIGDLARAFDTMQERLADRARSAAGLAADISHEFKTPLTGIRGAAELLCEGAGDKPDARAKFLRNILADSARLDRLVSKLLELSRAEASAPERARVSALEVVEDACDRIRERDIETRVVCTDGGGDVRGHAKELGVAIANLIDNAVQHAAPESTVYVHVCRRGSEQVEIRVHNVGSPIPEPELARVWDRFYTTRGGSGGTGLGLPITRTIVEAHGGTVDVVSSAEHGTSFIVLLPSLR